MGVHFPIPEVDFSGAAAVQVRFDEIHYFDASD